MTPVPFTTLRILDANMNRAREALRVMEEYARLGIDDASLAESVKQLRHTLMRALPESLSEILPAHRDIVGDVGCEIKTDAEYARSTAKHVCVAACKRLAEALRVIEEYAKTIDADLAVRVERIRYEGYELERRFCLTARARERFGHVRLYVLLTESLCRIDWYETAKAALDGGADCIQLREKDLPDGELLVRAKRLVDLCRKREKLCLVNDRPDIAAISHAHGVHLGQSDIPIARARRVLPDTMLIGISTHSAEQVAEAVREAPDYVAVGPVFPSVTKPQGSIAGPQALIEAAHLTSLPLVAVGGIGADNASQVLSAAPCCLCVCRAVISQADPAAAAGQIKERLK